MVVRSVRRGQDAARSGQGPVERQRASDRYAVGPAGPQVLLRHRDCGEPVRLQLHCEAGHVLESARDVTPVPGPGARRVA
ncbi:MAG: hypothetical protein ACRDOL_07450 [Streptosporangiaceae bacterium]